jgi:uncharacterized protein YecE (DUF72 family)
MPMKDQYYKLADQFALFREDVQELRSQQQVIVQQLHRLIAADEFDRESYRLLRDQYHNFQKEIEARLPSTAARLKEQVVEHERALRDIAQARIQLLLTKGNEFPPLTGDRLQRLQELNEQSLAHRQALQHLSAREPELKSPEQLPRLTVSPTDLQKMVRDIQYGVQGLPQALDRGL